MTFWRQGQLRLVSIWLTLDVFLCCPRQNLVSVPPKADSCFCTPQGRLAACRCTVSTLAASFFALGSCTQLANVTGGLTEYLVGTFLDGNGTDLQISFKESECFICLAADVNYVRFPFQVSCTMQYCASLLLKWILFTFQELSFSTFLHSYSFLQ